LASCREWLAAKDQDGRLARDLQEAADAEKVVHAQVARLEAGLSAERLQLLEDERNVQELADRSHGVDKQLRLAEQEMQFAERERESVAARQAQHEEEIGLLGQRLQLLGREEEGLDAERQKLADATADDETRRAQAESSLDEATERIHSAQHVVEAERHQAVSVLTRLANHRTNLVNLERRRQELSGRLRKTQTEGEELATRSVEISRQRDETAGKLPEAQSNRRPRHERAVEAVLGERLQLILVESHAAGLRAVDCLRQAAQGRASFVPLTEMEQLPLVPEAADLPAPDGTVRAADVVHCAPDHEKLTRYPLAGVLPCDPLATALSLWPRG